MALGFPIYDNIVSIATNAGIEQEVNIKYRNIYTYLTYFVNRFLVCPLMIGDIKALRNTVYIRIHCH